MVTTGKLRVFAVDFIKKVTRPSVVQRDSIRWIKDKNGQFPMKFIWNGVPGMEGSTFKEAPFAPSDTFILFDVIEEKNIASEKIKDAIVSQLPFKVIINIYGDNAPDELQYLLSNLYKYEVRYWLQGLKISLTSEPSDIVILDGRENASWWIRRRIELNFNAQQTIKWVDDVDTSPIEEIKSTIERLGDK